MSAWFPIPAHHRHPACFRVVVRDLGPGAAGEPEDEHTAATAEHFERRRGGVAADAVEHDVDRAADALRSVWFWFPVVDSQVRP
jgi:hypothetical protein